MKIVAGIMVLSLSLFASSSFKENKQYTCLNTLKIENGVKQQIDMAKALDMPLKFTIKQKEMKTVNNIVFKYKSESDDITQYSNSSFLVLLMKNKELGLIPKSSNGEVKYMYKCRSK